jgi:hypothetical protein
MMNKLIIAFVVLAASPALAASEPIYSLRNSNLPVLIAFLVFIGILLI